MTCRTRRPKRDVCFEGRPASDAAGDAATQSAAKMEPKACGPRILRPHHHREKDPTLGEAHLDEVHFRRPGLPEACPPGPTSIAWA